MTKRWQVPAVGGLSVSGLGSIGALALMLLAGCNQHPLQELDETVTAVNRQENRLPAKTKIDFLFVIDNSGSMCEEQDNLTRNFDAFSNFLFEDLGASADYRIAVTSTDMNPDNPARGRFLNEPALAVPSLNCIDDEGNPNIPNTMDCQELVMNGELDPVIKSGAEGNIGTNCNAADPAAQAQCAKEDLERKFRCLATLGTQGDGFEKGLEALRVALSCDGPNGPTYSQEGQLVDPGQFGTCCVPVDERGRRVLRYNPACELGENDAEPEFLRPDAVLVVIIVSDEDDCSDPATNPAASRRAICKYATTDADGNGIPDGFNDPDLCGSRSPAECYRAECGMLNPDDCRQQRCEIPRTENNSCEWFRSDLTPVQDYYRFLTSLKARPLEQLVVATIVGSRDYTTPTAFEITYNQGQTDRACLMDDGEGDDVAVTTDMCCPNGRCTGEIATSCESDNGEAFAGRRYLELAETLGDNGIGCPPPPEGLPADAQRVVACANQARDSDCQYQNELDEVINGQCRPVEGEGTLVCTECVTICEDDFAAPLEAIKEKVAQIVATYCLDKPPACQVTTEDGGTRPCDGAEERDSPSNYPIRVRQQCLLTEDQGGLCQELLPPTVLARTDWTLRLNQAGCDGGALVQLNEPPPAGAEVFVEFLVEVGEEQQAAPAVDGGAPAEEQPAP